MQFKVWMCAKLYEKTWTDSFVVSFKIHSFRFNLSTFPKHIKPFRVSLRVIGFYVYIEIVFYVITQVDICLLFLLCKYKNKNALIKFTDIKRKIYFLRRNNKWINKNIWEIPWYHTDVFPQQICLLCEGRFKLSLVCQE